MQNVNEFFRQTSQFQISFIDKKWDLLRSKCYLIYVSQKYFKNPALKRLFRDAEIFFCWSTSELQTYKTPKRIIRIQNT